MGVFNKYIAFIATFKNKASKGAKAATKDLAAMAKTAGAAGLMLTALGVAAKKTFDFAKEGAGLEQLSQSFDLMEGRLGLQIDLRKELIAASNGTIDAATLESGAMTLLAGASANLEKELGAALPQLLKIAKAANKVNPALGDTAFLFESIATGVKRGQPLILDNLGLTIKVGAANEAMAKSLGKTVEQLTAEEKQLAILNDVMRAGDILIEQAGGNVDSLGDSYAELEVNIKNATDEFKKAVSEGLLPFIEGINQLSDIGRVTDELDSLGISTRIYTGAASRSSYTLNELNNRLRAYKINLDNAVTVSGSFDTSLRNAGEAVEEAIVVFDPFAGIVEALASTFDPLASSVDAFNKGMKAGAVSAEKLSQRLLIMSIIQGTLNGQQLEGAITLQQNAERMFELSAAVDDGTLSWGAWAQIVADGVVTEEELNTALGRTTDELKEAELRVIRYGKELRGLEGLDIHNKVTTSYFTVNGGVLSGVTKLGVTKPIKEATGGVIPPGFPNDTAPAMLSSGETVRNKSQSAEDGVSAFFGSQVSADAIGEAVANALENRGFIGQ